MVSDIFTSIVFKYIQGKSLENITPIRLRFENTSNVDITDTLFGINYLAVSTSSWTTATTGVTQNSVVLNFGTALDSYSGDIQLVLTTSTDIELLRFTTSINLLEDSNLSFPIGSLRIELSDLSTTLANALLNYIFKNSLNGRPTTWYLQLKTNSNAVYQSRVSLSPTSFSEVYRKLNSELAISYGQLINITALTDALIQKFEVYDSSSGGNLWFTFTNVSGIKVRANRLFSIYNNTLEFIQQDSQLDLTGYLANESSASIFSCTYDGIVEDCSETVQVVDYSVNYSSTEKLFNSECLSCFSGEYITYSNLDLPEVFSVQLFVKFSSNPVGREIIFCEQENTFKLYKTDTNNLRVRINSTNYINTPWSPGINTWYHIYVYKSSTSCYIQVNNDITTSTSLSSVVPADNTNNFTVNSLSSPINGFINGLFIFSNESAFSLLEEPDYRYKHQWSYIDRREFDTMSISRWKKYSRDFTNKYDLIE